MTVKLKISIPGGREEASITAAARSDADNPPLSDEQLATMTPTRNMPAKLERLKRLGRSEPPAPSEASVDNALIDHDIAEHFRSTGSDWESRLNKALRRAIGL
jgi:uncharacterized protein (DUF4415 family)